MSVEPRSPFPRRRLARAVALGTLVVLLSTPRAISGFAQEPPLVDQPTANYYGAAGSRVRVAWSLNRTIALRPPIPMRALSAKTMIVSLGDLTTVPEDGELVATLTVTGATNPQQIIRPDLKKLNEFQTRFIITDVVDPAPDADAKEVKFSYRMRPRNRNVDRVPTLEFHYYNAAAAMGRQFPTTTAKAVQIIVTAPTPKPPPPAIALNEPDYLFAISTGSDVLVRQPFAPGLWAWVLLALAAPLIAMTWFVAWSRIFPDAVRQAKIRRSWAGRRAASAIRRAGRSADPPAALANAVLSYLRARFPLPLEAVTPTEIGAALDELSVPAADADAVAAFFRACDAARFSPARDNGLSLAADAEAIVARLEVA